MKVYSKDDIVEQAKELAKMISETEEVDFLRKQRRKFIKMKM